MSILNGFQTSLLIFQPINIDDVPEIHRLRTTRKNNYLSQIDPSIDGQYEYFNAYKMRNTLGGEVYLKIIDRKKYNICGFLRITNIDDNISLGWESLIIKEGTPAPLGIEICFAIYYLACEHLGRSILGPWVVTDKNNHMMKIHDYMGFVTRADNVDNASILIVMRNVYENKKGKFLNWGFANEFREN